MRIIFFAMLAFALLIGGYIAYRAFNSHSALTVSELNTQAAGLDGQKVTIEGVVSGSAGVLGKGGFVVTDGASRILVLSGSGIPEHGSQVKITGTFRKTVSLNSLDYSIIYRDDDYE